MTHLTDPMQLPLDGIRAVEASAGTGKTFTIATLYLRLILEHALKVDEIVVATFTRAAAAELSARLRRRLVVADDLLAADDPAAPREGDDGETKAARQVVKQALDHGASPGDLRRRAREARFAVDTAFIGTLHGFCHRVLAEFGFDTGQALRQPELIDDVHALELEIVRDFWRRGSADAETSSLLADTWKSPGALAKQVCDARWRGRDVQLPEPDITALFAEFERARTAIAACDPSATAAFERELERCIKTANTRNGRTAALQATLAWAKSIAGREAFNTFDAKATRTLLADAIEELQPKGVRPEGRIFDDLHALCRAHSALLQAEFDQARLPAARLLRDARGYLESELPRRLAARNLMGHDQAVDRLARALTDPARGTAVAARIRARWKAALVDEFQDTDRRQWEVVHALFGESTLVLVGDPKQAIYGFRGGDVFAWLDAVSHAQGEPLRLAQSWRAGEGMTRAINALFSRPGAFIEAGIGHPDVASAKPARALLRDGGPIPALQLWRIGEYSSKDAARGDIERACVAWIAATLADPAIRLRLADSSLQSLQPKHIAVLVNSNDEAASMQAALGRAGVPAASNLRASVYASGEADDLALLLDALAAPDDARRARAARASVLAGDDANAIAIGIADTAAQATLLEDVAGWAAAVRRHGPLSWLHALVAQAAPRLLALPDGERRVANYLQLAELLQDLHAQSFGLDDLAVRYARVRVEAADDADAARLRLDTDADAVTVATVHAAKGLEYDVVLVPFAVLGRDPNGKRDDRPPLRWYHDGNAARVAIGNGASQLVVERAIGEIRAEDVRKFYVAVTRAAALCIVSYGPTSGTAFSAAFHLLQQAGRDSALPASVDGCAQALHELCERAGDAAEVVALPTAVAGDRATPAPDTGALSARTFNRADIQRDWQIWSFSRLVRGSIHHAAADPLPGAGDADTVDADAASTAGLAGARFGTAVHAIFEQTDFAAWRDASGTPDSERELIERSLRAQGLAEGEAAMKGAIAVTGSCIHGALNAELPCGVRLCDVAPERRRAEIEFHLTLAPARSADLYALLHRHGYQLQRNGVAPATLHGLLTGKIDLTFEHASRFHIVDWKTNRCAPYDDAALRAEIAVHDYDLQWLVYTLALHRWLRRQLSGYDYDRNVGDTYYLFVRGMHGRAPGMAESPEGRGGIHADRPPRELVEAMDALFEVHAGANA
jgi:exodeoxyribonuclease V beta subunit